MRVLVACEFSGIVRDAFIAAGHNAASVDLLPSERPGPHYEADVLEFLTRSQYEWDLLIAHPPCTDLAVSGARWFAEKGADRQDAALGFVRALMLAPVERIAIENPVSVISSRLREPSQVIHPWQFGHPEMKSTCLWLTNLPLLKPTRIVEPEYAVHDDGTYRLDSKGQRMSRNHLETWGLPQEDRWRQRSRTYEGIAEAMATQWGRDDLPLQLAAGF